jgi:phosphoglucomutase
MRIVEPRFGLSVGDPEDSPLFQLGKASRGLTAADFGLILSASGWRGVFAASEEDASAEPQSRMLWPALAMAEAAAEYFAALPGDPVILLGCDSRPTGPALCEIFIRCFLSAGISCRYLFITPAPEIMAAARNMQNCGGFCYISASHNPIGHNGIKLGNHEGGVLSGSEAAPLIRRVKEILASAEVLEKIIDKAKKADPKQLETLFLESSREQKKAARLYSDFSSKVIFDSYPEKIISLRESLTYNPLGVVGELNGSARGVSIDENFLQSMGVRVRFFNRKPREICHAILPEGESLEPCRLLLEECWHKDPSFVLGYVPDNDGDRGNIVYIDPEVGRGHILQAQEVFALTCLTELSCAELFGKKTNPEAVVVNGPTSLRINEIAAPFGAAVFRAEVGEANVVGLARNLRKKGYTVRILGEGSNGGTITHPSAVRDPLNTLGALIKLLRLHDERGRTPASHWFDIQGLLPETGSLAISHILASLPKFQTTPTGEPRAKYPVPGIDHNLLKHHYETVFAEKWQNRPGLLHAIGVFGYRFVNYEGTERKEGTGNRSDKGRGGFSVELLDIKNRAVAFVWMRGSGTEPVFRIMADLPGSKADDEIALLSWHRSILDAAIDAAG